MEGIYRGSNKRRKKNKRLDEVEELYEGVQRISREEERRTMRKTKGGEAADQDKIPVEAWRGSGTAAAA